MSSNSLSQAPSQGLIVGVDAGGTKTAAWLGRLCQTDANAGAEAALQSIVTVLGRGAAGPGNPRRVGFAAATESLREAIGEAYHAAELELAPAAAMCLGVAGAGRAEEQQQLQQWCLSTGLAEHARVTGDALPLLAATYADRPLTSLADLQGLALICGTGSMAWGCCGSMAEGNWREVRAGGWGYLLGDEGSAYWIAMRGLQMVCRTHDEQTIKTKLMDAMLSQLKLQQASDLVEWLYRGAVERAAIAQLAPLVTGLAEGPEPDAIALQIVDQAAQELARLVRCVARQLDLQLTTIPNPNTESGQSTSLAVTGGVLLGSELLRRRLRDYLQPAQIAIVPVESPVQGALYLAANLYASSAT